MSNVGVTGTPAPESATGGGVPKRRGRRAAEGGTNPGAAWFRACAAVRANAAVGVPVLAVTAAAGIALAAQAGAFEGWIGKTGPAAVAGAGQSADAEHSRALPEPSRSGKAGDTSAGKPGAKEPGSGTDSRTRASEPPVPAGAVPQDGSPVTAGNLPAGAGQEAVQPAPPEPVQLPAPADGSNAAGSTSDGTEPEEMSAGDPGAAETADSGTAPAPAPSTATAPSTSTAPSTATEPSDVPSLISSVLGASTGTKVLVVGGGLLGR
ncbi:hypothetical protein [Arthrobacter sp. R-11]|uniref:hypothetical protein n=1 Tax=Arthrobacter sp. R-11 TaxID=3404053 RepID=UPI003CE9F3EC